MKHSFSYRSVLMMVMLAVLVGGCATGPKEDLRAGIRSVIAEARDEVFPALVHIEVVTTYYTGGQQRKGRGNGSGTIISDAGHVLTNYHVVARGSRFTCTLADRTRVEATLVGQDPLTDLAVLKLNLDELPEAKRTGLPTASFGDSDAVQVGDYVMAMGSPLSLSRSVTLGIVSNTERVLTRGGEAIEFAEGQRTGIFNRWIQHDALINPGSSGGPLVNLDGRIVGINARGGLSIGYAIPSNVARAVADAIVAQGSVPRSWSGVSVVAIDRTGFDRGLLVESIADDSPADAAGLKPGDLITHINGEATTVRFEEEVPPLAAKLANIPVGSTVKLDVIRGGLVSGKEQQSLVIELVTQPLEQDRGTFTALRGWGLTAAQITRKIAYDFRLDSTKGAIVSGVRSGDAAALATPPLQPGDIITHVDDEPIADLDMLIERYREKMEADEPAKEVIVRFDRQGKGYVSLLEPNFDPDRDPPRELPKAWVGVATQPLTEKLARIMGSDAQPGFRITRVYPGTKAAEAELRVGDIVTALNGEAIVPRRVEDAGLFDVYVRRLDIGDDATITVLRDGKAMDVKLALEATRTGPAEARRDRNRDFEMQVRELTFFDRDEARLDDAVRGVLVTGVESAGWAGIGGLRGGDIILSIDGQDIRGLTGYRERMQQIATEQPERVVFVVLRGVRTRFLFVEPQWKPEAVEDAAAGSE